MTVSSTLEARLRHRAASTAPARATAKALGIAEFEDDIARARFNDLSHWGYGTGWGVVRGLLGAVGPGAGARDGGPRRGDLGQRGGHATRPRHRPAVHLLGQAGGRHRPPAPHRLRRGHRRGVRGDRGRPTQRARLAIAVRAQVAEGAQQRLARGGVGRRFGDLVQRADEPARVLEVAGAAVALGEVRLEAGALGLGQRAVEVVGDELDELAADERVARPGGGVARRISGSPPSMAGARRAPGRARGAAARAG